MCQWVEFKYDSLSWRIRAQEHRVPVTVHKKRPGLAAADHRFITRGMRGCNQDSAFQVVLWGVRHRQDLARPGHPTLTKKETRHVLPWEQMAASMLVNGASQRSHSA